MSSSAFEAEIKKQIEAKRAIREAERLADQ